MFILLMLIAGVVCAQEILLPVSTAASQTVGIRHPDCPTVDELHHVMLPYPNDCSKYYSCLNGYAYIMSCPANLHWSELNYRCDYPEVARCTELLPIPYPGQFPLPLPSPGQNVPIYYADTYDCNQYYQCQKLRCPSNMLWSDRTQRCDLPYLSECAAKYPYIQYPSIPPMWQAYGNGLH